MKKILKFFLRFYLKYITKIILFIHKPVIIAVAGSTNKVFTKNAIKKSLDELGLKVKVNPKNFNTDIGMPLSILSLNSGYNEYKKWPPIMLRAFLSIFKKDFPEYLILNYMASDIGDMKYLLSIARPKITIITKITRKYIERFRDIDELMTEYKLLCDKTRKDGVIILSHNDKENKNISKEVGAKIISFGENENADFQITKIERTNNGEYFEYVYKEEMRKCYTGRFGKHQVYSYLIGEITRKLYEEKGGFKGLS